MTLCQIQTSSAFELRGLFFFGGLEGIDVGRIETRDNIRGFLLESPRN